MRPDQQRVHIPRPSVESSLVTLPFGRWIGSRRLEVLEGMG